MDHTARTEILTEIYDTWYYDMWHEEQEGERLAQEIFVITRLLGEVKRAKVLDMGAGFGRIAIELAALGHDVTAVEASRALIAHLRRESAARNCALSVIEGNWLDGLPVSNVDHVLLWGTSFGNLTDRENEETIRIAHAALCEGGWLHVELRNWDRPDRTFDEVTVREGDQGILLEQHRYDPRSGRQHTKQIALDNNGSRQVRESSLRRYSIVELKLLMRICGFKEFSVRDSIGAEFSADADRVVVSGRK